MQPLQLMITQGGLDLLVNAESGGTDAIRIVEVGLSETAFAMAPTIDALPGEIKRLAMVSGLSASETIIHMTAIDPDPVAYDLRGFGLYCDDGTLFAVFAQPEPLFRKVASTTLLFVQDIAFGAPVAGSIAFGDALFVNPPASETVKGVAEIATPAEAAAGVDHGRFITPLTLAQRLAVISANLGDSIAALGTATDDDLSALSDGFNNLLAALSARTITGGGLVSGGGDLTASRTLTVLPASSADVAAGTAADRVVTAAALSSLARSLNENGYAILPGTGGLQLRWGRFSAIANGTSTTLFALAFPVACFSVVVAGGVSGGPDSQDNPPVLVTTTISPTGFSVFSADDSPAGQSYIAIGF